MTARTTTARYRRWSLTRDGRTVEIRTLGATDRDQLLRLHSELTDEDRYLRFFTAAAGTYRKYVDTLVATGHPDRIALGAFHGDLLLGVMSCVVTGPGTAEFAVAVTHPDQAEGIGTLLLEHLVGIARTRGLATLTAEVLAANTQMLRVIADLGLPCTYRHDHEVVDITMALGTEAPGPYQEAVDGRDQAADRAALRPLLEPRSIAVVGAGRSPGSVGNAVLRNILDAGFTGDVVAVNPHALELHGVPCHGSVPDLPQPPDLAVICVPAWSVLQVVRDCGRSGVRAVVVISSGLSSDPDLAERIRAEVRKLDLRMVGPNSLGVLNTDPAVQIGRASCRERV